MAETQSFKQHKRCSNWVPLILSGSNCVNEAIVIEEHSHYLTKPSSKKGAREKFTFPTTAVHKIGQLYVPEAQAIPVTNYTLICGVPCSYGFPSSDGEGLDNKRITNTVTQ